MNLVVVLRQCVVCGDILIHPVQQESSAGVSERGRHDIVVCGADGREDSLSGFGNECSKFWIEK